ncbi:Lysozyme RrrD [compost metagenome]
MPTPTKTGEAGITIVKEFETLELAAYPDPASELGKACTSARLQMRDYRKVPGWQKLDGSPWTIGWGHTGSDVHEGLVITALHADKLLAQDLLSAERSVNRYAKVELNQNQFDALVSFTFNLGSGNMSTSTLLKKLNDKDFIGASKEFERWNKAKGKVLNGLTRRRKMEAELFLKKVA